MKNKIILLVVVFPFLSCNDNNTNIEADSIVSKSIVLTQEESKISLEKGKEIAQNTFVVLSGNVKQAMANGGIENALTYCNVNAGGLMDSLSSFYKATIKRTSHKIRNNINAPTLEEQMVIDTYLKKKSIGTEITPIIKILGNGDTTFYAPIIMQPLCLLCHGSVGKNISKEDYMLIKNHYPTDKAVDFKEGDLRGIWSITFKK